jgi:hypothetical protein
MKIDWANKLFVFITTLILGGELQALAAPGEWFNTSWGMSPSEIKSLYPEVVVNEEYWEEEDLVLETKQNILNYDVQVFFVFKKDYLYRVTLWKDSYESRLCSNFHTALTDAYGKGNEILDPETFHKEEWYLEKGDISLNCLNSSLKRIIVFYRGRYVQPGI